LFGSYCFVDRLKKFRFQISQETSIPRFIHATPKSGQETVSGQSLWVTALTGRGESLIVNKISESAGVVVEEIEIGQKIEIRPLTLLAV
jgi:hypothetical protein